MRKITRALPTFLSVVAIISIIWYLLSSYSLINNWWSLPLVALSAGILAIVLPAITKRVIPVGSIIASGIALFFIQSIVTPFFVVNFWSVAIVIMIVGIASDILFHRNFHLGEVIFDLAVSFLAAWLFSNYGGPAIKVLFLIIAFLVILLFDFNFSFSIKGKKKATENN